MRQDLSINKIDQQDLQEMMEFASQKIRTLSERTEDLFPTGIDLEASHRYQLKADGGWTSSFWNGLLYLCYEYTGEKAFLDISESTMHRHQARLMEHGAQLDHDIGFIYLLSAAAGYKLTKKVDYKSLAVEAARLLADRFNEQGRFIRAWGDWGLTEEFKEEQKGRTTIETMMNIQLLLWASEQLQDTRWKEIAMAHADTAMKYLVRDDGSVYHTFVFDPLTGTPKYGRNFQGLHDESAWSRGLAWSIYGFALMYSNTKEERYLQTAIRCADYFVAHMEEDFIPLWDFSIEQKEYEPRDTSAAAICASGLIELSAYVEEGEAYKKIAYAILHSLYHKYSTKLDPEVEGLIKEGTGFRIYQDPSFLLYGDYFFVESIMKLLGKRIHYWHSQ